MSETLEPSCLSDSLKSDTVINKLLPNPEVLASTPILNRLSKGKAGCFQIFRPNVVIPKFCVLVSFRIHNTDCTKILIDTNELVKKLSYFSRNGRRRRRERVRQFSDQTSRSRRGCDVTSGQVLNFCRPSRQPACHCRANRLAPFQQLLF